MAEKRKHHHPIHGFHPGALTDQIMTPAAIDGPYSGREPSFFFDREEAILLQSCPVPASVISLDMTSLKG
jgi:hypothetical protein